MSITSPATSPPSATVRFSRSLPVAEHFIDAVDPTAYLPAPDDWLVAVTDVVRSRQAIAEGRFKAVNMAGAAILSAAMNALDSREIPFVFSGDGAALAVSGDDAETVRQALAETAAWVRDDLDLELRAALVPVADIRAAGFDVRIMGLRMSDALRIYAFAGGGVSFAERSMKKGQYRVEAGPPDARPDLDGLSCRWAPMSAEGRKVVSLIVEANPDRQDAFGGVVEGLMALTRHVERAGHPMDENGPPLRWPPVGLDLEARARHGANSLFLQKLSLAAESLFAWAVLKSGIRLGSFDPKRYRRYTFQNTDYRKFQDGLRMTVSLTPVLLTEFNAYLEARRAEGLIEFGLVEQDSAIITCFVPQVTADDHFHFLDGAGGGYAEAASRLGH